MTHLARVIELTKGFVAIVSAADYLRCKRYNWHVHFSKGRKRKSRHPYARTTIKGKKVYLHRFVTDCPPGYEPDHKNHCTLDCRRENLEIVTREENLKRRRMRNAA